LWLLTFALGGAAGAVNAALAGNLHMLPRLLRASSSRIEAVQVGLIGNIVIAGAASMACALALTGGGCPIPPANGLAQIGAGGAAAFIGFAAARWCTNEADKRLLHRAVCKASEAPAAHPDLVMTLETARPLDIYIVANDLMPRRTGFR
jgi:hypothetical protein